MLYLCACCNSNAMPPQIAWAHLYYREDIGRVAKNVDKFLQRYRRATFSFKEGNIMGSSSSKGAVIARQESKDHRRRRRNWPLGIGSSSVSICAKWVEFLCAKSSVNETLYRV